MYKLYFTKHAIKDAKKLKTAGLHTKCQHMLDGLCVAPFKLPFEKLTGNLKGCFSRRINLKHRLIYKVYEREHAIQILRMWSHYE